MCVRKLTASKRKKKKRKAGKIDRWKAGNEMETSRGMKRRRWRECGNNPEKEKESEESERVREEEEE